MSGSENPKSTDKNTDGDIRLVTPVTLSIGVAWIFFSCVIFGLYATKVGWKISRAPADWGDFGSLFGGVAGTTVALFALMALVQAVRIQRKELEFTKNEIKRISKQMIEQQKESRKQQFESTLQFLLELNRNNIESIRITRPNRKADRVGRTSLKYITRTLSTRDGDDIMKKYKSKYSEFSHHLANYFRILFQIAKFISDESYNIEFHMRIYKAQISEPEVLLLALNGLTENGENFKPLIEDHGLLEHLSEDQRTDIGLPLLKKYNKSAFGSRPLTPP